MSVPQRAELEAQVVKPRRTISAMPSGQDKFGLTLKLKRLEEELAGPGPRAEAFGPGSQAGENDGDVRVQSS